MGKSAQVSKTMLLFATVRLGVNCNCLYCEVMGQCQTILVSKFNGRVGPQIVKRRACTLDMHMHVMCVYLLCEIL